MRVVRTFKAPPERIFDAFLDPDQAKHFMFVMGEPLVRAEICASAFGEEHEIPFAVFEDGVLAPMLLLGRLGELDTAAA